MMRVILRGCVTVRFRCAPQAETGTHAGAGSLLVRKHLLAAGLDCPQNKEPPEILDFQGFSIELPIRIELMTFSLRVKRSTD